MQGLAACVLHELGHCAVLLYIHVPIKSISITAFGAQITPGFGISYGQEFAVAAAGPAVNLLVAHFCCVYADAQVFAGINLALAAFNLMPVYDLDGARMMRCLISGAGSPQMAFWISECLSFSFTVIFGGLGFIMAFRYRNITMLLMCFWLMKRYMKE